MNQTQSQPSSNDSGLIPSISIDDSKKLLDAQERHGQLFSFTSRGIKVIFRALLVSELETIQKLATVCNPDGIDEWTVDKTLVWSNCDVYLQVAGFIHVLAEHILKVSSMDEATYKNLITSMRDNVSTLENMINATIVKVFPILDTKRLDMFTKVKYQAISEKVLNSEVLFGSDANNKKLPRPAPGFSSVTKQQILSKENADKPDFDRDNAQLRNV